MKFVSALMGMLGCVLVDADCTCNFIGQSITTIDDDYLYANCAGKCTPDTLTTLYLSNNQITTIAPDFLSTATELNDFGLSSNNVTAIPSGFLANSTKLTELSLNGNAITTIAPDFLSTNPELLQLYLKNNQIRDLPAGFLSKNTKLHYAYLGDNPISALPAGFLSTNTKLQILTLDSPACCESGPACVGEIPSSVYLGCKSPKDHYVVASV